MIRTISAAVASILVAAAPAQSIPPPVIENQVDEAGRSTLMAPTGQAKVLLIDSGVVGNRSPLAVVTWTENVRVEGAAWIRIWFDEVTLSPGSTLRITSLHDGQRQVHDAASIAAWSFTSAYFNGDSLSLELVSAPGTAGDRVQVQAVTYEVGAASWGSCGICGNDDRVPSFENHSGRLRPNGCSSTIYSTSSCIVTAGHCIYDGMVMQFNVPPSNSDCSINNPPVEDQFPITDWIYENDGIGDDWAVLLPGVNSEGLLPYEKYGMMIPIATAPAVNGNTVETHGYGSDSQCVRNYVQQTTSGTINDVNSQDYSWDMDTTFGQSGSNSVYDGAIIAIVTHCSGDNCHNRGTRVDAADFAAARAELCPIECLGDLNSNGYVNFNDLLLLLAAWGTCPDCPEDLDGSGNVGFNDLLLILNQWGPCP